jgi:hypothetical protein
MARNLEGLEGIEPVFLFVRSEALSSDELQTRFHGLIRPVRTPVLPSSNLVAGERIELSPKDYETFHQPLIVARSLGAVDGLRSRFVSVDSRVHIQPAPTA